MFPLSKSLSYLFICTQANGESSYNDGHNIATIFKRKYPNGKAYCVTDNPSRIHLFDRVYSPVATAFASTISTIVDDLSAQSDLLITISGHGYKGVTQEYIKYKGVNIQACTLRDSIYRNMKSQSFILIDTCHAGTLLSLPYKVGENNTARVSHQSGCYPEHPSRIIAVCSGNELTGEDLSDVFYTQYHEKNTYVRRWGGKLTCSFVDYWTTHASIDIYEFYKHIYSLYVSQEFQITHPQLLSNCMMD
jgi:hypothetical protein